MNIKKAAKITLGVVIALFVIWLEAFVTDITMVNTNQNPVFKLYPIN